MSKLNPKVIRSGTAGKTFFALPLLIFLFLHLFLGLATNYHHPPVYCCLLVLLLFFSPLQGQSLMTPVKNKVNLVKTTEEKTHHYHQKKPKTINLHQFSALICSMTSVLVPE